MQLQCFFAAGSLGCACIILSRGLDLEQATDQQGAAYSALRLLDVPPRAWASGAWAGPSPSVLLTGRHPGLQELLADLLLAAGYCSQAALPTGAACGSGSRLVFRTAEFDDPNERSAAETARSLCARVPAPELSRLKVIVVLPNPLANWVKLEAFQVQPNATAPSPVRLWMWGDAKYESLGRADLDILAGCLRCLPRGRLMLVGADSFRQDANQTLQQLRAFLGVDDPLPDFGPASPRALQLASQIAKDDDLLQSKLTVWTCAALSLAMGALNVNISNMLHRHNGGTNAELGSLPFTDHCRYRTVSGDHQLSVRQIAVAVEFSDANLYGPLAGSVCSTWLNSFSHAVIYTDVLTKLPPGSPGARVCAPHLLVVPTGRPELNTSIGRAQAKRELVLQDFAGRFTKEQVWRISTEQDTWWSVDRLLSYLQHVEIMSTGNRQHVMVGAGNMREGLDFPRMQWGPFMVLSHALLVDAFSPSQYQVCKQHLQACKVKYPGLGATTFEICMQRHVGYVLPGHKSCTILCMPHHAGCIADNDHVNSFCLSRIPNKSVAGSVDCVFGDGCFSEFGSRWDDPFFFFWQNKWRRPPNCLTGSLLRAGVAFHQLSPEQMEWISAASRRANRSV